MLKSESDLLKKEITDWVQSIDDQHLLNLLSTIKVSTKNIDQDWWEELTENQKENIRLGMQDFEEGKMMSSEQFWENLKTSG